MASAEPEPILDQGGASAALLARSVAVLLDNGQTTEGTKLSVERLATALGRPVTLQVWWGQATLHSTHGDETAFVEAEPVGVDISRVAAAEAVMEAVCARVVDPPEALRQLKAIGRASPVPLSRFAPMAAAGAGALAVIFGAPDALTVALVAVLAGAGACLRRAASRFSGNPLLQPLVAALLTGVSAGLIARTDLPVAHRLVAACPCMILVPGPHFLNGMIDLVRSRIPLGVARLTLAGLIVLVICTGLLTGLAAVGMSFPQVSETGPVPLPLDVLAAGVAVAAYGSFFNMPWRMMSIPVVTGMIAHSVRWELLQFGVGIPIGAFGATLVAGSTMALVSHRLRLPFGAAAFACVVSLIPGVYMFQVASGLVSVTRLGSGQGMAPLLEIAGDVATTGLTLLAMATGLIVPKLCWDGLMSMRASKP